MSRLLALPLLSLSLFLNCTDSFALSLEFDHEFDSDIMEAAVLEWGSNALSRLPPSLNERIPDVIRVRFRSWGNGNTITEPQCADDPSTGVTENTPVYEKYGRYNSLRKIVYINSKLLPELVLGSSGSRSFDCYHGDFYRLATATLLHEIAHAYDALDLDASVGKSPRRSRASRTTVSTDPFWTVIDGFNYRFLGFRRPTGKNRDLDRLPSPHAEANELESFAVHFEYFLFDPDYPCRFPSHNEYLEAHFSWSPSYEDCQPSYTIVSGQSAGEIDLDPERVYQVRYLLASPGPRAESKLGHSMLHLVLCAPGTPRGPECLEQEEQDLALGFAANTDVSSWHFFKGIVGTYDSMVFFTSLHDQLQVYNGLQMRDVTSYPLDLSRRQIQRITLRALELYWTYRGPYRFFTNNCATETEDLLKAGVLDERYLYRSRRTPRGVLRRLIDAELIDEAQSPIVYESAFDSATQAAVDLYDAPSMRGKKSLHRWIEQLSFDERLSALEQLETELDSLGLFDHARLNSDAVAETMTQLLSLGRRLDSFRLIEATVAHIQENELGYVSEREQRRIARGNDDRTKLLGHLGYLTQSILDGDRDSLPGYGIPIQGESEPGFFENLRQEFDEVYDQVSSWEIGSAKFAHWQQELDRTMALAERRYALLRAYADLSQDVRTEIFNRAVLEFPEERNPGIRSMLEDRFGEGSFEPTRFSDARINRLR